MRLAPLLPQTRPPAHASSFPPPCARARQSAVLEAAWARYESDRLSGRGWQSFWLPLTDAGFAAGTFNELLRWMGIQGCHFTGVLHANAPEAAAVRGGYSNAGAQDPARLIDGNCSVGAWA